MGRGVKMRNFTADKKVRLVAQNVDTEFNEVEFLVEVEDRGETRLFRHFFDLDTVLHKGVELVETVRNE